MNIPPKYEDVVAQLETERARVTDYIAQRAQTELKLEAALGREAALREELDNHDCATLLINAWVDAHGKQIPWDKAIEIIAVATKMPDAEKTRLLCLDDQYELLQQRLTVAEQRSGEMEGLLSRCAAFTHDLLNPISLRRDISAALKPAEDYNELDDDEDLEVFDDQ